MPARCETLGDCSNSAWRGEMNISRKMWFAVLPILTLSMALCASAQPQGPADLSAANPAAAAEPAATADPAPPANPAASADPAPTASPAAAAPPAAPAPLPDTPSSSKAAADDGWRGTIAIYGWFPAVHGTVGVLGHNAGFDTSFSDIFHTLKGIIPVAVELDKGRFIMPIDFLWMKLGDDQGDPL